MLYGLLKASGLGVNGKRAYRLHAEEAMQVRAKKRKKLQRFCLPIAVPIAVNQRWSMDFVAERRGASTPQAGNSTLLNKSSARGIFGAGLV